MQKKTSIKYAKGFDIQYFDDLKKLIIKSPYPNASAFEVFYLLNENVGEGHNIAKQLPVEKTIKAPLNSVVVTSTTHIPMLEAIAEETSLIGFPNLNYISSAKTNQLIEKGSIRELGKEEQINTEVLLALNPDAVIGFSLSSDTKMYANIEKAGIPVILKR